MQVAPAELEAALLKHPAVDDAAVIPISDDYAGERPKAFVVRSKSLESTTDPLDLKAQLIEFAQENKASYKRLADVTFVDSVPKSPSGKILRRLLRDQERLQRRHVGAKI